MGPSHSPFVPLCHIDTHSFSRSWRRGSPSLLSQHTANLIKSQIHNTLFKVQMFFTETSRRKGAERNGPRKVIRIIFRDSYPITQSSLSVFCAAGGHLETTSLASYTFMMPQMETPQQSSPGVQGKVRFQSLVPEHLSLWKFSAKNAVKPGRKLQVAFFQVRSQSSI